MAPIRAVTALAWLTLSVTVAASADKPLPHYDPDAWCNEVARAGGEFSEVLHNQCMRMEQSAYDDLKPTWGGLPQSMQSWCDQIAKAGGKGSYTLLKQCVDMERNAAEQNKSRQFKY